jgi:hypothetical protein
LKYVLIVYREEEDEGMEISEEQMVRDDAEILKFVNRLADNTNQF